MSAEPDHVNGGERVDLLGLYGRRTVARWRYQAEHGANDQHLALGWLPDGRWWVGITSEHRGWIYSDERDAWALAEELRAQPRSGPGTWIETIAEYEPGVLPIRAAAVPRYHPVTIRSLLKPRRRHRTAPTRVDQTR